MLDLSCEYRSKNVHVTIDKSLNVLINDKEDTFHRLNAKDCIGVVEVLKTACLKYKTQNIFKQDFKLVVEAIKTVETLRVLIKHIRGTHLSYKTKDKANDELNSFVNEIFYNGKHDKIKFSKAQQLALHGLTDEKLYYGISSSDFDELYLPISRSVDKINKFYDELVSFPFGLMGCDFETIVKEIDAKKEISLLKIKAFETIMEQAGDDIVNWTQHKISRRLGEMDIKIKNEYRRGYEDSISYYQISSHIEEVIKNLNAKGVKATPVEVTAKKPGTKDKLLAKRTNGGELTQNEIVTLFKQSDLTLEMIHLMSYQTICDLMASPLKVVKEKLLSRHSHAEQGARLLITRAMELAPHNKQEFDRIFGYANSIKHDLPWEYLYKNIDFISTEDVVKLADENHGRSMVEIPSEFYDKHFSNLGRAQLLNLNSTVTREFVSRLSEEDKIGVLPRLGDEYVKRSEKNSINFILDQHWWDSIPMTTFDYSDLFDLYKDVPWAKIKETVLRLSPLRKHSSQFAHLYKDKEAAAIIIKESASSITQEERVSLLKMFKRTAQIKMVLAQPKAFLDCYDDVFTTQDDLLALFENFIGNNDNTYLNSILSTAQKSKLDMSLFRNLFLKYDRIVYLTLSNEILKILDRSTKEHLLRIGTLIEASGEISHYRNRTTGLNHYMIEFFKGFKRDELLELLRENLVESRYRLYLCHVMTLKEREQACDLDTNFLRVHIESMHYDYLKKYQGKEAFKKLVGDRRDRSNNNFASSLERKFQEELKTKTNPANSIKLMFA